MDDAPISWIDLPEWTVAHDDAVYAARRADNDVAVELGMFDKGVELVREKLAQLRSA